VLVYITDNHTENTSKLIGVWLLLCIMVSLTVVVFIFTMSVPLISKCKLPFVYGQYWKVQFTVTPPPPSVDLIRIQHINMEHSFL
jgi:ABC-type phosphate transport system permease subunit